MMHQENGESHRRRFSEMPRPARFAIIAAAAIVLIPAFLALFGAVTMWLWNWLMPAIFKLPAIGFWQAVGLLVLSHILFRGGHFRRAGRQHWKKEKIREHMREEGAPAQAD